MNKPIIHVLSYSQLSTSEYPTVMPIYHLDRLECPVAMPQEYTINSQIQMDNEFYTIGCYQDQMYAYDKRLRLLLEQKDPGVRVALDNIYNQAISGGVVIATLAQVIPFYTHAHVLKDLILELAQS